MGTNEKAIMCETRDHLNDIHAREVLQVLIILRYLSKMFTHIGRYLSQSGLRTKERTKQLLFRDVMASLQLLEDSQNLKYDNFVY